MATGRFILQQWRRAVAVISFGPRSTFGFSNSDTLSQLQSIRICACPFCYITKNFAYLSTFVLPSLSFVHSQTVSFSPSAKSACVLAPFVIVAITTVSFLLFLLLHLSHCLDRLSELLFRNLNLFIPFKFVHNLD